MHSLLTGSFVAVVSSAVGVREQNVHHADTSCTVCATNMSRAWMQPLLTHFP